MREPASNHGFVEIDQAKPIIVRSSIRSSIRSSTLTPALNDLRQIFQLDRLRQEHIATTPESFFVGRFGAQGSQSDNLASRDLVFLLVRSDPLGCLVDFSK